MSSWFEGDDGTKDEWALWTGHALTRSPGGDFGAYLREFPRELTSATLRDALRVAPESPHATALFATLFSGTRLLIADSLDDETTYVATAPGADGKCAVFKVNPRTASLDAPGWPSITAWLSGFWEGVGASIDSAPALERSRGAAWLVCAFMGIGYGDPAEDTKNATPLPASPDGSRDAGAALYWLWHHAIAGNTNALSAMLRSDSLPQHPWIAESVAWLTEHAATWDEPFDSLTRDYVMALRSAMPPSAREG